MLTREQYENKAFEKTGICIKITELNGTFYYYYYNKYLQQWVIPHSGTFKTEAECYEHWINNFSNIVFKKVNI